MFVSAQKFANLFRFLTLIYIHLNFNDNIYEKINEVLDGKL